MKLLEYEKYADLYLILEKNILLRDNVYDAIVALKGNPIADFILDLASKTSYVPGDDLIGDYFETGDKAVDFPKDVKNIDILDIDDKTPTKFKTMFFKGEKLMTQETKIGKVINALIGKFNPTEIETFVRLLSTIKTNINEQPFIIKTVDNEKIPFYYMNKNYIKPNSRSELGNSCMNGSMCQSFVSFYSYFPDTIKMLVMLDPNEKLIARALLWKLDNGKMYLDRIYGETKISMDLLHKYALENGIKLTHRLNNGSQDDLVVTLKTKYPDWENLEYPYLDTFTYGYVNKKNQLVMNADYINVPPNTEFFIFDDEEGGYREGYMDSEGNAEMDEV